MSALDLFRCSMDPSVGRAITTLYTPDPLGRVYCGQGKKVDEFEHEFADATGLNRVPLGTNSASASIDLALHLIGVGPDDEVITTPLTCSATNGSIVTRGAKIVWADINPLTGLLDPLSVAERIGPRTKAIIAVDWAGRLCDYAALEAVAGGIPIIEDAAHCLYIGAQHGDYVAWSFGPIKHLSTGGYGGALLPPHDQMDRARLLRWHGLDRTGPSESFRCEQDIREVGYRYHMTDDQAVVGLANLGLGLENVDMASLHARYYSRRFAGLAGCRVPDYDASCNYWLFGMLIDNDRDLFMQHMASRGIPTSRVHARNDLHTAFRAASVRNVPLPGVDAFDAHQINIPVGRWLSDADCERVARAVEASLLSSGGSADEQPVVAAAPA